MKLITEKGELALPADFQFDIEENNPFFSQEGTQSIPATLPMTADTARKLEFIQRPNNRNRAMRKMKCTLKAGIIHKYGTLVIDSSEGTSITGAIMLNESTLYSSIKDTSLKEIFADTVRTDYKTVTEWYYHLVKVYRGEISDDFALFPVATNKTDNGYNIINQPDPEKTTEAHLLYDSRQIYYKDGYATVPLGFGISPFLYLYKVIEIIFEHYGYTVTDNPFKTDALLSKIVLLNNCTDTIVKKKIDYSQLVPDCTVSEFIEFLQNKFHAAASVNAEAMTVSIKLFEDCLKMAPEVKLTQWAEKTFKTTYQERKALVLSGDAVDDYPPAAETFNKLVEKYSALSTIYETQNAVRKKYYFRPATMEYYDTTLTETWEDVKSLIGGSNFALKMAEGIEEEKIEFSDLFFRMITHSIGQNAEIMMPYIGEAIYNNTLFNGEKVESSEQKIMICYAAGQASTRDGYLNYYYGTASKYDNLGYEKFAYSLYTQDIYKRFWSGYAKLLLNQDASFTTKIRYPLPKIASMDITAPVSFQGMPVMITSRNIQLGENITYGDTAMMPLKLYEPTIEYTEGKFSTPVYVWQVCNDLEKVLNNFSFTSYEITGFVEPGEFASLTPPTEEEYLSGDRCHEIIKEYAFSYTKGSHAVEYGTIEVTWWVEAIWP